MYKQIATAAYRIINMDDLEYEEALNNAIDAAKSINATADYEVIGSRVQELYGIQKGHAWEEIKQNLCS